MLTTASSTKTVRALSSGALLLGLLLLTTAADAQTYSKMDLPIGIDMPDRLNPMGVNTSVLWDGSTIASMVDDDEQMVDMGFSTTYFGFPVGPMIRVSSNGYVTFGTNGLDDTSDPIPSNSDPDAVIALFWDDLNIFQGSTTLVMTETQGVAPNRVFIVEYANMDAAAGSADVTGQIRISEVGTIELRYVDPATTTPMPNYGGITNGTAGIENFDGSNGVGGPNPSGTFTGTNPPANNYMFTYVPPQGTDFVAGGVSLSPGGALQGDTIQVTTTITNLGTMPSSSAFRVGVYLSDDPVIGLNDTLLGVRAVGSLGSQSNFTFSTSVIIPQVVNGGYFVGVIVDDENVITEVTESNNGSAVPAPLSLSSNYATATSPAGIATIEGTQNVTTLADNAVSFFDDVNLGITLPFDFAFFGTMVSAGTSLTVNSNGYVAFTSTTGLDSYTNVSLPDSGLPTGMFAPLWDDLRAQTTNSDGKILTKVDTVNGNQVLIVEWIALDRFGSAAINRSRVSFQLRLTENTNEIEFHYDTSSQFGNGTATIGLENIAGTEAVTPLGSGSQIMTFPQMNLRLIPVVPPPGDANRDGVINVADVQETINQVIRLSQPTTAGDFDGDGLIDIRDVQLVINRVLLGP